MKIRTAFAAAVLALVPAVSASAQCMDSKMTPTTAMSCAQGTVWDADT
jgi:hypothetical protein